MARFFEGYIKKLIFKKKIMEPRQANTISSIDKFFITELKNIYWAEYNIIKTLPRIQEASNSSQLEKALLDHLDITNKQLKKLEEAFELIGENVQTNHQKFNQEYKKEGDLPKDENLQNIDEVLLEQKNQLNVAILKSRFEFSDYKKKLLVEKIKSTIIELVNNADEELKINLSDHLSEKLNHDYTYLANIFSKIQGISIEKFFINYKIDRVKELLVYEGLQITEIAYQLRYSSVAHLSNQFKKVTGVPPSHFKKLKKISLLS